MTDPTPPASPALGLRASYDAVAQAYERRYSEELRHKPLDRALLRVFADDVGTASVVGDAGCGPGHITAHLYELGLRPVGIDLSPRMIELARERFPDVDFAVGSMLALPADDHSWAGMVAFYSIIHLTSEELPVAFAEFARVLAPGGPALLTFHVGDEVRHVDELLEQPVDVDFHLRQPADVIKLLRAAGFDVEMSMERAPYISIEAPTQRGYVLARAR
ncbi:MAG TPA: class I SAM-dependent methyltransferase [Candidatus Dormibacteraeota bacterium]|nr:class I SAM-dependent methyltransferase [Candidatus Dormibacteraeota bacterium]